jgi:hypothetical protein
VSEPELVDIEDSDGLFRRIVGWHVKPDGKISSKAFTKPNKKPDPEISVDLARLCNSAEETCSRGGCVGFGVVSLFAELPRSLDLGVRHDPKTDGTNHAHSLIEGNQDLEKCRLLAEGSSLEIRPPRRG